MDVPIRRRGSGANPRTAPRVTWQQALTWRMERHFLGATRAADASTVVRRLCGVQAQILSSAELAVRVRCAAARPGEVAHALTARRLIRTWAMRGTLHLLAPQDAGIFLALIAAARPWETPAWVRWFGMTPAVVEQMRAVVRDALDGQTLTREELIRAITAAPGLGHLDGPLRESWGTAFKPLAWQGDLCLGPSDGALTTFMRPDASLGWKGLPDIDYAAPAAIATYLSAYGPATADNFHGWLARSRVPKRLLRQWWGVAAERLALVDVDGRTAHVGVSDLESLLATRPSGALRLLPGFDQWILGAGTDDPHVVPAARRRDVSRQSGWISPTVIAGGRVRGTWKLDSNKVRVNWFGEAGKPPRAALADEVLRLSTILGRPLEFDLA